MTEAGRPQPDRSDLRPVTPADVPQIAPMMARAFEVDPGSQWVFRNPATRLHDLEVAWQLQIERVWLRHDACVATTDLQGAACWLPPGAWRQPVTEQLALFPAIARGMRRHTPRALAYLAVTERHHPHDDDHWYLPLLGVDPSAQGRGFGSHLLAQGLARCDAEGRPAYLETLKERNVAFYERHGFRVTKRVTLPFGGPPIWLMWRDPA